MPLDPSIPLQARGPQIDAPQDVLGKILALRGQQQQQQIQQQQIEDNTLKLASAHRSAAEVEAAAAAIKASIGPDGHPDYDKAASILEQQGFPERAQGIRDTAEKSLDTRLKTRQSLNKLREDASDHLAELALSAKRSLVDGMTPSQVRDVVLNHVAVAAGDGTITEADARQFLLQTAQAPPAALHQVFDQFLTPNIRKREADAAKTTAETKKAEAEAANIAKYGSATPPSLQSENVMVNGKPTQVTFNPRSGKRTMIDAAGQEVDVTGKTAPIPPASTIINPQAVTDVKEAVTGMREGTIPPMLPGRASKEYLATMAEAHRQGYDLQAAVTDWNATQKHVASMNNAQQLRLNQSINALPELLDSVDALASKWHGGRFPLLNKANLALAKGGAYGEAVATVARQLDSQIADVTADLGNVYMGGNSPTDHALQLAGKSLSGDWSEKVLHDMVKLARGNVTIRQNSIRHTGVQGASATNPYAPPAEPSAPASGAAGMIEAKDPQGNLHHAPAGTALPAGWTLVKP